MVASNKLSPQRIWEERYSYLPLLSGYYRGVDQTKSQQNNHAEDAFIESLEGEDEQHAEQEKRANKQRMLIALFLCLFDVVPFCISFASVQYLCGAVGHNELNSCRYFFTAIIAAPFAISSDKKQFIPTSKCLIFLMLCMASITTMSTLYAAAIYIPIGTTYAISTASSIVSCAVFTPLFEKQCRPKDVDWGYGFLDRSCSLHSTVIFYVSAS